jgi:hypothetical protein
MKRKSRFGLPWIEPAELGRPRWTHANPQMADEAEVIYEPLRDLLITYTGTALGSQGAYAIPINGSYTPLGSTTAYQKSRYDTNLKQAGQLPNPNKFQVEGMTVQLHPNVMPLDAKAWATQMLITFTIGDNDKRYVEGQPLFIPGAGGLHISGQTQFATAQDSFLQSVSNGWPINRNVRILGEDLASGAQIIEQGQTFGVTEDPTQDHYNSAYTTAATTTKPPGTGIMSFYALWGHWLRGVQ